MKINIINANNYQNNCDSQVLLKSSIAPFPGLQSSVGEGSVWHARLVGDIFGVLGGRLDLANDIIVEVAGGALCPVGHCVLVHCKKGNLQYSILL